MPRSLFGPQQLIGRRIINVIVGDKAVHLSLDDGSLLTIQEDGSPGADSEWYNYPVILKDGYEIWRG